MADVLGLINQFGLPVVLVVVLAFAFDRQQKKHEEDRKRWDETLGEERKACAEEREAWAEERRDRERQERAIGERLTSQLLESQKNMVEAIRAAGQMATAFENEKREVREARERDLMRDTGQHRPVLPPRRGP